VRDPLDLEERLANLISDRIVPRLVPELEILPWRRSQVLAVQVYPSPSRPHHLKREGLDGGGEAMTPWCRAVARPLPRQTPAVATCCASR
jgi:predicted HTH transcriptional regulator